MGESKNVSIWIIIGFQQRDRQDSQNLNKDMFCRLPVVSAQAVVGLQNYQHGSVLSNYDDD